MRRLLTIAVMLILCAVMIRSVKAIRIPLDIEYPRPMFISTPCDFRQVPNLQKPRHGHRPEFLVPPGTSNVALGKPVSSSDDNPVIGRLSMITDDNKQMKGVADCGYVELEPPLQHVTIDLQHPHEIFAIVVWHYPLLPTVYFDVVVRIADDPDCTRNVRTLFNNDIDNSAGLGVGDDKHYIETNEGKLIDARGHKARYVRLYSNGSTRSELNHYAEVAVYGRLVD